jgi:hypothetical protein
MLKKEETVKGAVVEVFQIKKGVEGAPTEDYVLVTREAGSALDGGWGVRVGTTLEIIEGPKRRNGINTAIVKFDSQGTHQQGHVFWCELRASCRLVKAAPVVEGATPAKPARKTSAALKAFSEKQLQRLPAAGYWVETLGNLTTVYCVLNGAVKYVHANAGSQWGTLLWSCCPTAKQIAERQHGMTYEHFADHASLLARYPNISEGARIKAPNDL